MRFLVLVCTLGSLWFVGKAQAQIGKTPEQCLAKYGKSVRQQDGATVYEKDGLSISVTFAKGKADSIRFHHLKGDAAHVPVELTNPELETLLNANGAEHGWMGDFEDAAKVVWSTEDNAYLAIYNKARHELSIVARGHKDAKPPMLRAIS